AMQTLLCAGIASRHPGGGERSCKSLTRGDRASPHFRSGADTGCGGVRRVWIGLGSQAVRVLWCEGCEGSGSDFFVPVRATTCRFVPIYPITAVVSWQGVPPSDAPV